MSEIGAKVGRRIPGLDAIRALAIIMVMTGHYILQFLKIEGYEKHFAAISNGGVILFFILSGYLIYVNAQRQTPSEFVIHRIFRLYPAYVVSVLIIFVFGLSDRELTLGFVVANFLMMQDLLREGFANGVFWSLVIEVKFYFVVWVFCFFGWLKHIVFLPPLIFVLNLACLFILGRPSTLLTWFPLFFVGVAFARCDEMHGEKSVTGYLIFMVILSVINLVVFYDLNPYWSATYLVIGAIVFLLLRRCSNIPKFFSWLAAISYSLYLYHTAIGYPVGGLIAGAVSNISFVQVFAAVFVSFVVSYFSYVVIERPSLKIGKSFFN